MQLGSFLSDRIGWQDYLKPFMEKPLTGDLNWSFTLGSVCALLFLVEASTGMLLALYYNPSPDHAYQAIDYIMKEASMGRILRGIHHWGASAMVILAMFHMVTTFFYGAYKPPRELTWIIGVGLLVLTSAFGFTGYLLPWDQKAYWATIVGTNLPSAIPVVGKFITQLLRGGEDVSGLTLTRFYSVHILILPALMVLFICAHIYLIRIHNLAGHWNPEHPGKQRSFPFFPDHLFKSAIAFSIVFSGVILLSIFVDPPREQIAMTPDPSYSPRPEWYFMWLFQLLTYFSGPAEIIGTIVVPIAVFSMLVGLPFFSKSPLRSPSERPLATSLLIMGLVAFVYLTLTSMGDSYFKYGEVIVVPDRDLTHSERRGVQLWLEKDCSYCHNILGKGGRRQGPDLSNSIRRGRSHSWFVKAIKDPQSVSSWSIMPKYDLSQRELSDLANYILSLDFRSFKPKVIKRSELLPGDKGH